MLYYVYVGIPKFTTYNADKYFADQTACMVMICNADMVNSLYLGLVSCLHLSKGQTSAQAYVCMRV